ncbi:hypothetical protein JCM30237_12480 [Halolamina litorea]|uniref:Uncharacterized protein n=1 Tax=Halolamina litorea TaxID=1515593 RepID=A0ABD6BN50_9EURY|nr:hypothetical protein [Halolamina litorea]
MTEEETVGEQQRLTPGRKLTLNLSAEEREAVFHALDRGEDDLRMSGREEDMEMADTVSGVYSKIVQEGNDAE